MCYLGNRRCYPFSLRGVSAITYCDATANRYTHSNGTAYDAIGRADPDMPYHMGGKSGSAQVVSIAQDILSSSDIEVSDLNKDHALFIAFAPALHESIPPQIAVAVFVENGESGGAVAGPIAKAVIDAYLLDILKLDLDGDGEPEASSKLISQADD